LRALEHIPASNASDNTSVGKEQPMMSAQVQLVQDSFAKVKPIAATAADLFYDRLFGIAPDVRRLLPEHTAEEKRLTTMLGLRGTNPNRPEMVVPAVKHREW